MASINYLDLALNSKQKHIDLFYANFPCNFNFSEKYHSLHHSEFPVSNSIVDLLLNLSVNLEKQNNNLIEKINKLTLQLNNHQTVDDKGKKPSKNNSYIEDSLENINHSLLKLSKQIKNLENIPLEINNNLEKVINKKISKSFSQINSKLIEDQNKLEAKIITSLEKQKKLLLGDPDWNKSS